MLEGLGDVTIQSENQYKCVNITDFPISGILWQPLGYMFHGSPLVSDVMMGTFRFHVVFVILHGT